VAKIIKLEMVMSKTIRMFALFLMKSLINLNYNQGI